MTEALEGAAVPDESAVLQARIRDLEAALNQNNLDVAVAFQLTPALANLLGLLLSLPLVSADTIRHRLEIVTDPKVAIHRLRKALARWNSTLGLPDGDSLVKGRRHVGYWIEPEHKELLKSRIASVKSDDTQRVTEVAA
jgi:hypothetical protein